MRTPQRCNWQETTYGVETNFCASRRIDPCMQSFQQADKNSKSVQTGERDADGVRKLSPIAICISTNLVPVETHSRLRQKHASVAAGITTTQDNADLLMQSAIHVTRRVTSPQLAVQERKDALAIHRINI